MSRRKHHKKSHSNCVCNAICRAPGASVSVGFPGSTTAFTGVSAGCCHGCVTLIGTGGSVIVTDCRNLTFGQFNPF
ncbi:hypothetical protein [Fictibacillus fluitans]|uniref:C-CAP/cofactor C-like domain-containing protein n=1 Tax=Fictibacillus fluitans TaxID=3058422 RepID=A0ABT8HS86_9BACL|nr:hypothetical protein [Fictibacillus sp. NE201]MDN4523616.1 hypothetical protein [Fictibacillus sp. NE201]